MTTVAGYGWLMQHYGVEPVQPLPVRSEIGGGRATHAFGQDADGRREVYPDAYRPEDTPAGHLAFALKREGVQLAAHRMQGPLDTQADQRIAIRRFRAVDARRRNAPEPESGRCETGGAGRCGGGMPLRTHPEAFPAEPAPTATGRKAPLRQGAPAPSPG